MANQRILQIILISSGLYFVGRTLAYTCTLRNLPPCLNLLEIKIGLVFYSDSIPWPGQSILNFNLDSFSKDFLISFLSLPGRSVRPIVPRWKRVSPEKRMSL